MRECDLIMKGGITSGVVYPRAIRALADKYRLRSIGGTSAGAIAAVLAAAAEYRRQTSPDGQDMAGYDAVADTADELGMDMQSLFQPSLRMAPLFEILMAVVSAPSDTSKFRTILKASLKAYRPRTWTALFIGLAIAAISVWQGGLWTALLGIALGIAVAIILVLVLVGYALYKAVLHDLPEHDFGICSGLTLSDDGKLGFSDWIAEKIDRIAGNLGPDGKPQDPLTVGQLSSCGVKVATMTTDLSSQRPYRLPLMSKLHLFSEREFKRLFPERIVNYLKVKGGPRTTTDPDLPDDLYWLPPGDDFPILLVARMSLSFPGLIRAVPLYRFDYQLGKGPDGHPKIRRCLFSDGGISSNFPIHFFDALLPRRPTFGIALASWEEERHKQERVDLPERGRQSTNIPIREINGLGAFLFSILNTAKDWQDTLQSLLPGYAERIVEVRLDDEKEGGMNLKMSEGTIQEVADYGRQAGQTLVDDFDFDRHRYSRALSLLPNLEGVLDGFSTAYAARPDGGDVDDLTYAEILTQHPATIFPKNTATWRETVLKAFADGLADIGATAAANHAKKGRKSVRNGHVPSVDARISLVAEADRVPAHAADED